MSNGRLRSPRSFVRGPRRKSSWALGPQGFTPAMVASQVVLMAGTQLNVEAATLVRSRGEFLANLLSSGANGDGYRCAVGLCVVTENAFNAGVTAVPAPLADLGWDGWYWHREFHLFSQGSTVNTGAEGNTVRFEIDSKAMRKMKATDFTIAVLEVVETGVATMDARIAVRELFKLA